MKKRNKRIMWISLGAVVVLAAGALSMRGGEDKATGGAAKSDSKAPDNRAGDERDSAQTSQRAEPGGPNETDRN